MADSPAPEPCFVLYNPYSKRTNGSSKESVKKESVVHATNLSDDSDELTPQKIAKQSEALPASRARSSAGMIIKDSKQQRAGFFSNIKTIMSRSKSPVPNSARSKLDRKSGTRLSPRTGSARTQSAEPRRNESHQPGQDLHREHDRQPGHTEEDHRPQADREKTDRTDDQTLLSARPHQTEVFEGRDHCEHRLQSAQRRAVRAVSRHFP